MPRDTFAQALAHTLQHEGGYVFDPADPGGETKYGISKRSFPGVDIKRLTLEEASIIYRTHYWEKPGFGLIGCDPDLVVRLFDLGVNCGTRTAAKMLQRAANVVCAGKVAPQRRAAWRQKIVRLLGGSVLKVDGVIGQVTVGVIRACPYPRALLAALKGEAYNHYRELNPLYIPGWLERLES